MSLRTHFEVLGLEGQVPGLDLENCPVLGSSTIFGMVKILQIGSKFFFKSLFVEITKIFFWRPFFLRSPEINFEDLSFFGEHLRACVLGPWLWPRAFLSLASRVSVLERAVLGLESGVLDSTSGRLYTDKARLRCFYFLAHLFNNDSEWAFEQRCYEINPCKKSARHDFQISKSCCCSF